MITKNLSYYLYKKYNNKYKKLILCDNKDIIEIEETLEIANIEGILNLLKDLATCC